ncbi:F-box/kelch-repeat protein [Vitis vinifera]|uniref:F-box/kelch-repeat protein n=1 Tax=Vitis vinifera TaxID=29760 RepID=A0A438GZE8_VITVI|nr:F-box/kelch-repeat protein [Vitis vinifera]
MARERDECKGVFHRGKFHAIGGYCTEMQGRFERSAEAFDFANWEWDKAEEDFLEDSTCPRTCVDGGDMGVYMCHAGEVVALQDSRWQTVDKLPAEIRHIAYMTTWEGKLLVIGCRSFGEAQVAYMWDLKSGKWWRRRNFAVMFSQVKKPESKANTQNPIPARNKKGAATFPAVSAP